MRRLVPLSLVALLLVSGCLGALGGTDSTSTPGELAPGEANLPPGVSESGLENASALIAGYNETVREVGIVLNVTATRPTPRSGEVIRRHHTVIAPGGRPFNATIVTSTYDGNDTLHAQRMVQFWGNESTTLKRSTLLPPVECCSPIQPRNAPTQAKVYLVYFETANYTIDSVVERDGHTFTTLVADEPTSDSEMLAARVVVDERGLIRELTLSLEGDDHEIHREYRVIETDPSPPERPDWTANVTQVGPSTSSAHSRSA